MPIVSLSNVDVFAFLDSDSDEAKGFTTYLNYVRAIDDLIVQSYPRGHDHLVAVLQAVPAFGRLKGKPFRGDAKSVRTLLLNGWVSEMHLHTVDDADPGRVRIANHAAPVHSYYATSRVASAWIVILKGNFPTTHATLLNTMSEVMCGSPHLYPGPWSLRCSSIDGKGSYSGFPSPPQSCSNLSLNVPVHDRLGQCLRTTRQRQVDDLVAETRRQKKLERAPKGEKQRRDSALKETTMFDFLWRSRTRSNYGDPAMFYMGALTDADVLRYHEACRNITSSTNLLFEALIAQRAQSVLEESAIHFISRDRSGLADKVLVPRLAALGIATSPNLRRSALRA